MVHSCADCLLREDEPNPTERGRMTVLPQSLSLRPGEAWRHMANTDDAAAPRKPQRLLKEASDRRGKRP